MQDKGEEGQEGEYSVYWPLIFTQAEQVANKTRRLFNIPRILPFGVGWSSGRALSVPGTKGKLVE